MKPLVTANEIAEVRRLPQAILFIACVWAIQSRQSESLFLRHLTRWENEKPGCSINTFRVDLSDQEGGAWEAIRHWLQDEEQLPCDAYTYGGNGAILWVRNGTVVASTHFAPHLEYESFAGFTKMLTGPSD